MKNWNRWVKVCMYAFLVFSVPLVSVLSCKLLESWSILLYHNVQGNRLVLSRRKPINNVLYVLNLHKRLVVYLLEVLQSVLKCWHVCNELTSTAYDKADSVSWLLTGCGDEFTKRTWISVWHSKELEGEVILSLRRSLLT